MSRYSRRRTQARSRTRSRSSGFHPVVAFLIIASFGILFAGCGSVDVRGPDIAELNDVTFTADDVEKLATLGGEAETASGSVAEADGGTGSSLARIAITPGVTGTGSTVSAIDPELRKRFDAIRTPSEAVEGNVYRVTNVFVNVRSSPSSGGAAVARLNEGERVVVTEFVNASWAKVTLSGGVQGYVSTRYISRMTTDVRLAQEEKAFEGMFFVDYAFVNVRASADAKSAKMGEIPGQTILRPASISGDWARVSFEGKEGYVSMQFLSPFRPTFIVRQENFVLPILRYDATEPGAIEAMVMHAGALKNAGASLTTLRSFHDLLLAQEVRDVRLPPKSVIIAVTGITAENVRRLSDALYGANVPATLFLETRSVGVSGISQKLIATLQANGFDLETSGHTGDDLRSLTNSQVDLELRQSRQLLEDLANRSVLAVAYPEGGVNDRIATAAANAGYLFGIGSVPESEFGRDQFLRLPGYSITSSMTGEDVVRLLK